MRFLLLLAVLLPVYVQGATISTEWCDADQIVSAPVGDCPGIISNLAATPSETSVLLTYSSTSTGGTSYVYIVAGSGAVPPGCAANSTVDERRICTARVRDEFIVAGTGADAAGSQAATDGQQSISIGGLQSNTAYTAIVLDKNGPQLGGLHGEPMAVSFTTDPSPVDPGPGPSDPPEWYVGTGGSDLASGLTRVNRLATLAQVLTLVGATDDVAIEPGSVFEDYRHTITIGGTELDRAIWGTNYESGGVDYWWDEGPLAETLVKASNNGTYEVGVGGCAYDGNPSDCAYALSGSNPSAVPPTQFAGCWEVDAAYVTLVGYSIEDCAGNSLMIDEAYGFQSHFVGRHVDITGALKRAVQVTRAVEGGNALFDHFTMTEISRQIPDGLGGIWSGCVSFDSNNNLVKSGILMQNSELTQCGGEGLSTLRIGYVTFRNNFVANSERVLAFADASSNVIFEYNMFVMSSYTGSTTNEGFVTAVECYGASGTQNAVGNIFRNNIVLNADSTSELVRASVEGNLGCPEPYRSAGYDPRAEGFYTEFKVYGNVFAGQPGSVVAKCTFCGGSAEFYNNVFEGTNLTTNVPAGWDFDHNYWISQPAAFYARGANDVYGDVDGLSGLSNDATWDMTNRPILSDVTPPAGSSVLNAGTPLSGLLLDINDYGNFAEFSEGCVVSESQWEQQNGYADFDCTPWSTPPNIGVWEGNP